MAVVPLQIRAISNATVFFLSVSFFGSRMLFLCKILFSNYGCVGTVHPKRELVVIRPLSRG